MFKNIRTRIVFMTLFSIYGFHFNAFSQGKFLPAYVIPFEKDTIKGTVRYESWDESPAFIEFKSGGSEDVRRFSSSEIREFSIPSVGSRYKSYKIGVLNIDLSQTYSIAPSFEATDSLVTFLRVVTSGPEAELLEFINRAGEPHYFILKNAKLTELINYPFYRLIGEKKYLLTKDDYKKQLPTLLSDSRDFDATVPNYDLKNLKRYVDKYNASFGGKIEIPKSADDSEFEFDLHLNGGIESWKETGISMKNKMFYGFGVRLNLPRRFQNRYFRVNFTVLPGISTSEVYNYTYDEKLNLKTIDVGVGTHFGSGKIRPNFGMDYSFPLNTWRTVVLGPHFGVTFKRQVSVEIGHFANFNTVFSDIPFFNKPRISVNYFLNLNRLIRRK